MTALQHGRQEQDSVSKNKKKKSKVITNKERNYQSQEEPEETRLNVMWYPEAEKQTLGKNS